MSPRNSGKSAPSKSRRHPRFAEQALILDRLSDILESQGEVQLSMTLLNVAIALMAKAFPPQLSTWDCEIIRRNAPESVTPESIHERAMSEEGVESLVRAARLMAQIALDYSPSSSIVDMLQADRQLGEGLTQRLTNFFWMHAKAAHSTSMSPFGVLAIGLIQSLRAADDAGLNAQQIQRCLLEMLEVSRHLIPAPLSQ